jgi:hypothetical protein
MSSEYEEEKSSNKTVLIIVVAVASVLIVALVVCGGLGYMAFQGAQKAIQSATQIMNDVNLAQATGERFLGDIASGHLEDAYAATSDGYQKEHNFEQFKQFIDKNAILKSHTSRAMTNTNFNPNQTQMTLQYSLSDPGKTGSCSLTIVKEGEQWKIDRFTVP